MLDSVVKQIDDIVKMFEEWDRQYYLVAAIAGLVCLALYIVWRLYLA